MNESSDPTQFTEYRADGWPLCPRCGEDELMSHIDVMEVYRYNNKHGHNPPISDYINAGMLCLRCYWQLDKKKASAAE